MGGERQDRESLWGARRRPPGAKGERTNDEGVSAKSQHVLDLQRQAGNAAVTGVVQRSMWGDDSWMENVGNGAFLGQDNGSSNQGQANTNPYDGNAGLGGAGGAGGAGGNQDVGYKEMSGGESGGLFGDQNGAPFGGGQEQAPAGKEEASFPWGGTDQSAGSKDEQLQWK